MLVVENLSASFFSGGKKHPVLSGVSFSLARGETLAIVGKSGSGKTTLAHAIARLDNHCSLSGRVLFEGQNTLALKEKELQKLRGKKIAYVFQDPLSALNPTRTIGSQVEEQIFFHGAAPRGKEREKAEELLAWVDLHPAALRFRQYPHELSGGMRQRALVAMAVSCRPSLLIADEPTAALDYTLQTKLLQKLQALQRDTGMGIVLISHDLKLVAKFSQKLLVLDQGSTLECGSTEKLLKNPEHPFIPLALHA